MNVQREKENKVIESSVLLYRISKAIASIKDGFELLKVIVDETQPVFGFHDIGLYVLSKDKQTVTDWAAAYATINPSNGNFRTREFELETTPFKEMPIERLTKKLTKANSPLIFDYHEYLADSAKLIPIRESVLKIIEEGSYKEFIAAKLSLGGKFLGILIFNSTAKNLFSSTQFSLFQAVADLVAVAVANIIANEEIIERDREKSILLEITELIAQVKDVKDLLSLIAAKIKPIFNFHDCGIFIVSPNGNFHTVLAATGTEQCGWNRLLADASNSIPHKGSVVEWMLGELEKEKTPILTDYQEMVGKFPDYPQFKMFDVLCHGYRDCLSAILTVRDKTIGLFCINALQKNFFQEDIKPLFQAVANSISIAIANILANEEINQQLNEIIELKRQLEAENTYLLDEVEKNYNFGEIIGFSPRLREVFEVIETVAPTDATVLIQGETGTGKELVARAIHNRSDRNSRPLIKVNCAALPKDLVESELFGHEKGSFTGAYERRIGKFELADNGTIFLDEVGELPLDIQVKLLRVLQEKEIERLGGKGTINLNLRVIAATNRNLSKEVQVGRFRADLYYRLCTVELFLPTLSERKEDIKPLTLHFARKYAAKFSRKINSVSNEMLTELNAYNFPGNIRELEHIVEHAVIFSKTEQLILPRSLATNSNGKSQIETSKSVKNGDSRNLQTIEREHINSVLKQTNGRIKGKNGAAEILGLNPATLYFRMKKLGITKAEN